MRNSIYEVKYKVGNAIFHRLHLTNIDFDKQNNIHLICKNISNDWIKIDRNWKNIVKVNNRFFFIKKMSFLNKKDKLIIIDSNDISTAKSYKYIQFFEHKTKLKLKKVEYENNRFG